MLSNLQVVIKITERCNINCDYCYMFNQGNDDYLDRPIYIKQKTVEEIAEYIATGALDIDVKRVSVVFHGGEPLMLKKRRFDLMCDTLRATIERAVPVDFAIQTNATLIDEEWIDIFEKHRIHVGVSIDGPPEYNDVHRVDHKGLSSYTDSKRGIDLAHKAWRTGRISRPGAICVINPAFKGDRVYRHLVDELKFTHLSINLPMETHDTCNVFDIPKIAQYITAVFDEWAHDNDPNINVRMLGTFARFLVTKPIHQIEEPGKFTPPSQALIVIASDGEISVDDPYMVINFAQRGGNVRTTTLRHYLESPLLRYVHDVKSRLSSECLDCCWQNFCGGGSQQPVSRYSIAKGFDNKSVLCDALKDFYAHASSFFLNHGLPLKQLMEALEFEHSRLARFRPIDPIPQELFTRTRTISIVHEPITSQ